MTESERNAAQKLMQIGNVILDRSKVEAIKLEFIIDFSVNVIESPNYLIGLLEKAYMEKDSSDVEYVLSIGFVFDLFKEEFANILCNLIEADWHFQHENIALILQKIKSPRTVNSLYNAALSNFKYLEYSDVSPLAVKCIWAIGGIKTEEAREKLKLLAQSSNEIIKKNAVKQLGRQ